MKKFLHVTFMDGEQRLYDNASHIVITQAWVSDGWFINFDSNEKSYHFFVKEFNTWNE